MSALGTNPYQDAGDDVGPVLVKLYESGSALDDMRARHDAELKRAIEFAAAEAYALGFEAGFAKAKTIAGDHDYWSRNFGARWLLRLFGNPGREIQNVKLIRGEDA